MMFQIKRVRIVHSQLKGYRVQVWRLWFPFWVGVSRGIFLSDDFGTLGNAIQFASWMQKDKKQVVVSVISK